MQAPTRLCVLFRHRRLFFSCGMGYQPMSSQQCGTGASPRALILLNRPRQTLDPLHHPRQPVAALRADELVEPDPRGRSLHVEREDLLRRSGRRRASAASRSARGRCGRRRRRRTEARRCSPAFAGRPGGRRSCSRGTRVGHVLEHVERRAAACSPRSRTYSLRASRSPSISNTSASSSAALSGDGCHASGKFESAGLPVPGAAALCRHRLRATTSRS